MAASIEGVGRVVTSPLGFQSKIRAEVERRVENEEKGILRKSNAADPGADQAEGESEVPLMPFVWPVAAFVSTAIAGFEGATVRPGWWWWAKLNSAWVFYSGRSCQHGACKIHCWHHHRPPSR